MKNFESDSDFLPYRTALQFLEFIRSSDHPYAIRDYCFVYLILEYGWRPCTLLDKKVSDILSVCRQTRLSGHTVISAYCKGRPAHAYLFSGRTGERMTERNMQLRLNLWAEQGGFGRITSNMLLNTHRIRALCRDFFVDPLCLPWSDD